MFTMSVCGRRTSRSCSCSAARPAGFQDPAPNVDNFLLLSGADHAQILADPAALAKTLDALGRPCVHAVPPDDPNDPQQPGDDPPEDPGEPDYPGEAAGGCSTSHAGGAAILLVLLAVLGLRQRRHAVAEDPLQPAE